MSALLVVDGTVTFQGRSYRLKLESFDSGSTGFSIEVPDREPRSVLSVVGQRDDVVTAFEAAIGKFLKSLDPLAKERAS